MKSLCTQTSLFLTIILLFANLSFSQNCSEYPYIDCQETNQENRNAQFFTTTIYDCNNQVTGGNILGYDGYRLDTEDRSEIKINISNSNFSYYLTVGTDCTNPKNIFCNYINSSNYSKTIDVSSYDEVFIGINYVQDRFGNCEVCRTNYELKVECTSSDPTENCREISPACHQAYEIYPNLAQAGEYTIEYGRVEQNNEEPYDWLINGKSYKIDDGSRRITHRFRPGKRAEVCYRSVIEDDYNPPQRSSQTESCISCCFDFCPPEDLFDCDIIKVGQKSGGGPLISVPKKKYNQDITIINWYAHKPNGQIIYKFKDGERNSTRIEPVEKALTRGNGKIYFTLVYKLGAEGCIQVCCICYDTDRRYEGAIVPIPVDDHSNWLRFQSIEKDVELLHITVSSNDGSPVQKNENDYLLTPGRTYDICYYIKDGDCYSRVCFQYCPTDFRNCSDISLTGTSENRLTYSFNGFGSVLNWFTADGSNRSSTNKENGIVPDSYTEKDGKVYCVKYLPEVECIQICCYEDRCVEYIPPVFEDYYASNGSLYQVRRVIGKRGSGSKKAGPLDQYETDTLQFLRNISTGQTEPYTGQDISSFPDPSDWEICHQIRELSDPIKILEEFCFNGGSIGEGNCEAFPMALPFDVSKVNCDDEICQLRLDGSSSMGEDLQYVWTVYKKLSNGDIELKTYYSESPVKTIDDTKNITGIHMRVLNGCGSSSVYLSCSDFTNQCRTFDDIGSSFFNIGETAPQKVSISSDFNFGDGAQYEIDFGDGSNARSGTGSSIGSLNHTYPRPGIYYVCVRVRYYCDIDHGPHSDRSTTRNCCELIFCKFVKVGCTETIDRCDIIGYENFSMNDDYVTLDLTAQGEQSNDSRSEWLIDGKKTDPAKIKFQYGKDYHCCYVYYNSEGCLVRCCRKFRFDPENHCGLIQATYEEPEEEGKQTLRFNLSGIGNTPISWTVKGKGVTKHEASPVYNIPPGIGPIEICVLYYDREGCLRVCCYCINVPKEECKSGPYAYTSEDSKPLITFDYIHEDTEEGITYQFSLNQDNADAESWDLTSEEGQLIQSFNSSKITCPPGWTGKPVKVCVLYRSGNCYYYRCFPVVFRNPLQCELLNIVENSDSADDTQVNFSGTENVLDYYWTLNGKPVTENASAQYISMCCLDQNESNILCFYYKVSYNGYCVWKICCIELEGSKCDIIETPIIEDLYMADNTVYVKGRRASSSRKSGIRVVLPCDNRDTTYVLKNLSSGEETSYKYLGGVEIPEDGQYELCTFIKCHDKGFEGYTLQKSCITIKGGLPGACKVKPMALPFTWGQVGQNCLQVFPVKCFYRFDAGNSMGDDLTYSWSVYYPDTNNLIDNSVHFSTTTPVLDTALVAGFTAVKLTVSNNCGSSSFYMACSGWSNSCLDFSEADEDFFKVDASNRNNKTIKVNSSFTFPATGDVTIDFGDGETTSMKDVNRIGSISHDYDKPGVYYVCVRVLLTCETDNEHETKNCCEIIFCKFVEVGCVKYTSRCDWLSYDIWDVKEDHVSMGLYVTDDFPYEVSSWMINGEEVSDPDSVRINYGETYYYCITYIDAEGCLVECCRKIKFEPPNSCHVIQSELKSINLSGDMVFDFSLPSGFENILFWGVIDGTRENTPTYEDKATFTFSPDTETYTICVLYYDREGCLRFCCYCLKVEPPSCSPAGTPYEFHSAGKEGISYSFDVKPEGSTDISWTLIYQEGNQLDASSDNTLTCPPEHTGTPLFACISYRIGNCYYLRCIPVICIDPRKCNSLSVERSEEKDGVFDVTFTEDIEIEASYWTINGIRQEAGENQRSLNICCLDPGQYEVCFYYLVRINGYCYWRVCCYPLPSPCKDDFDCDRWFRPISADDDMISYTYDNDFVEVSRIEVNGSLVSENEREVHLNPGDYNGPITICYYIIGPDGCIYTCCKTIDPHCDCAPGVDPQYCETFNGKMGQPIGVTEPDWWTPTSDAVVKSGMNGNYLDASSGNAVLDLKNKSFNYLSVELELGNCNNWIIFDLIANAIDDEGSIFFPANSPTGSFYQNTFVGIFDPFFFDRSKRILLELTGDQLKTVLVNGVKVGEIYAPELISFNGDLQTPGCMKIYSICIGNKKKRIPRYCGNQITQSIHYNDFETFKDGDLISVIDPTHWIALGNLDAQIYKNYIFTGNQLSFQNGGGFNSDVIFTTGSYDQGQYQLRWEMAFYDPESNEYRIGDYYILKSVDTTNIDRRVVRVSFNGDPNDDGTGEGRVTDLVNNQTYDFTYPINDFNAYNDRIFENLIDIDLDGNQITLEINGQTIQTPYLADFAGIEYLANDPNTTSDYHIDNLCFGGKSSGGKGNPGNPGGSFCPPSTPLSCGTTVSGTTSGQLNYYSKYTCVPSDMYGGEEVYSFEVKPGDPPMRLNIFDISNPDLQVIVTDDCALSKASYCKATDNRSRYRSIDLEQLPAGTYYVFIDGPHRNTKGSFKIQLSCEALPCINTISLDCNQSVTGNNYQGTSTISYYPSCPIRSAICMTAPEQVYTFTPDTTGVHTVRLNIHNTADLDVFILDRCDPNGCVHSGIKPPGEDESFKVTLEKGKEYYLVVDGQFDQKGSFDLLIECPKDVACGLPDFDFVVQVTDSVVDVLPTVLSGVESLNWDFGDGFTSAMTDPDAHTYAGNGRYTICGTAENTCGKYKICKEILIDVLESPKVNGMRSLYSPLTGCVEENDEVRIPIYFRGDTAITNLGVIMQTSDIEKFRIIGFASAYSLGFNILDYGSRVKIFEDSKVENYDSDTPLYELILSTGQYADESYQIEFLEATSGDGEIRTRPVELCLKKKSSLLKIKGQVRDYQSDQNLESVSVRLDEEENSTDYLGRFEFTPQNSTNADLTADFDQGHPRDRINVLDIKAVKQHWAEYIALDPFRKVAADVNNDLKINALDWGLLTQLVGHQIDSLPNVPLWRIYRDGQQSEVSTNHNEVGILSDATTVDHSYSDSTIQLYAIKTGDVSDKSVRSRSGNRLLLNGSVQREQNKSVIRFSPAHDTRITAAQFCIQLPVQYSAIQLSEVSVAFEEAVIHISSGKVYVIFAPMTDEGVLLKQGETIFTLRVNESTAGKPLSVDDISMDYSSLTSIVATGDGKLDHVALSVTELHDEIHVTIHPNPFSDYLWIQVANSHEEQQGRLELYNLVGQQILNRDFTTSTGTSSHFVQIDQPLPAGMYIARWTTKTGSQEFKLIKK